MNEEYICGSEYLVERFIKRVKGSVWCCGSRLRPNNTLSPLDVTPWSFILYYTCSRVYAENNTPCMKFKMCLRRTKMNAYEGMQREKPANTNMPALFLFHENRQGDSFKNPRKVFEGNLSMFLFP